MATTTENYGLKKPLTTDYYDVEVQNENMDRIDTALKEVEAHIGELDDQNVKLGGEQVLTGVKFFPTLISNSDNNHLQFFRNFSKEWHVEALENKLSVVQSGTAERLAIGKDGNISVSGSLNISAPTQSSHAANKQYVDDNKYVHPSTAGNKHIPAGGAANQVLQYSGSSGTTSWQDLEASEMKISSEAAGIYNLTGGNANVDAALKKAMIPTGSVHWFASAITPEGYLYCNGAAISRTVYARLFTVIGTSYGIGNGSTTFNIPDLRAAFIRGIDDGKDIDTGRVLGTLQVASRVVSSGVGGGILMENPQNDGITYSGQTGSGSNRATGSVRPYNMALLPCIKF